MKKSLLFLSLFLAAFVVLAIKNKKNKPQQPPAIKQPTFEDALSSINEKDCFVDLSYFASDYLEGRMSGKKGNVAAAEYILRSLEECGLRTTTQQFKISRANPGPKGESGDDFTRNVYGWIDGCDLKDEIVVVGAHFDHIGYGPKYSRSNSVAVHNGADDNASGTTAVLAIARAMSGLKPSRTVVFQFYSAEEMGLVGSRFYCNNPIFPVDNPDIRKHVAMINLDMVGHLRTDEFKVSIPEGIDMWPIIGELAGRYRFASKVTGRGTGGSDHASFYNKKIPVAFIHTGTHKYYHTPQDDVSTLNIPGVVQISKYAFELAWRLANEKKPSFDEASFKEMPYTHDHGENRF
jgi:hypothetical protein